MEALKLGFIGAGFVANFHATALRQIRGADLVGVFAPQGAEELARKACDQALGACKVYDSVEALVQAVDVICLFAPNFVRVENMEAVRDAVKKGAKLKGLICEKPLGRTMPEARKIAEMAEECGCPTAYFENQIHMNSIQTQLAQLAPLQAVMGPLSLVRSSEEHAGPHMPWFWDPVQQGGGVLSDMACHSIAVSWYALTPAGKDPMFLEPVSVSAEVALLKWGRKAMRDTLLHTRGVDYAKTPAEDFATGMVTFRNPETGQLVKGQFTNSWMYDKQGLRLFMDGLGPGYAFEINTLQSPLNLFIGDDAATAVADAESALEKATASRGLLAVAPNEADLYGYTDEMREAIVAFREGRDGLLNLRYGLEVTRLCQAAYMSAEQGRVIDLTDKKTQDELEKYVSLIAQGRGREQLQVEE